MSYINLKGGMKSIKLHYGTVHPPQTVVDLLEANMWRTILFFLLPTKQLVVLQILWRGVSKACHPSRKHLVHNAILDYHAEKKMQTADTWSRLEDRILEEQRRLLKARNLSHNLPMIMVTDRTWSRRIQTLGTL